MSLFRRKTADLTADDAAAVAALARLDGAFSLRRSAAQHREAWQAAPAENATIRFLEAAQTLGLDPVPTRPTADQTRPTLIEAKDGTALNVPNPSGAPTTLPLTGEPPQTKPRHAWTFARADAQDRSAKARLAAINPLKSLGLSRMGWVLVASLLSNILALATSLFVMVVYDRVLPNEATESLYALAFGVAVAVLFDTLLKSARSGILDRATSAADRKVTEDIFDQYVEARPTVETKSVGELASVIRSFEGYRDFMTTAMVLTFVDLPFVVLFIFVIAQISGALWIIPALAVPAVLGLVVMVQPLIARSSRRATELAQSRQSLLVEMLSGLDHLRVTGAYGILKRRFLIQAEQQTEAAARARSSSTIVGTIITIIQQMFQVALIVFGFHLFITDQITMGGIIAAVILFGRVMAPLSRVGQTMGRGNQALAAYRVVRAFLATDRTRGDALPASLSPEATPALEMSNVTLRLSENAPPLLNGVNLRINHGEKVAIVGRTGAGKTSMLRLFAGLLSPESGAVTCNGISIGAYPRADLHKRIGTVFQASWLFAGTLRDNVGLGQVDVDDAAILRALRMAGLASDDGPALPLDMTLAEQGANLSGGQRQAVNVARAFASCPDIYLMDEPSSAMDTPLEFNLVRQIQSELADKTIVLVTHKAKLLELCDRIVVVEKGAIRADVPAAEYFKKQEAAREAIRKQAAGA